MPAHVSAQEQPAAVPHAGAIVENTRTHSILENTFYINIHKSSPPPYRMQVLYLRTHSILENTFYTREHILHVLHAGTVPESTFYTILVNIFYTREHILH